VLCDICIYIYIVKKQNKKQKVIIFLCDYLVYILVFVSVVYRRANGNTKRTKKRRRDDERKVEVVTMMMMKRRRVVGRRCLDRSMMISDRASICACCLLRAESCDDGGQFRRLEPGQRPSLGLPSWVRPS